MKKIMIVDDHAGILSLISIEAAQKGYLVVTASNGKEALNKFSIDRPDLILLDIMMPVMNGFEMLSSLRKQSCVPVIVHSFNEQNKETAFKLGANEFVLKPFDTDKLFDKIKQILDQYVVQKQVK